MKVETADGVTSWIRDSEVVRITVEDDLVRVDLHEGFTEIRCRDAEAAHRVFTELVQQVEA